MVTHAKNNQVLKNLLYPLKVSVQLPNVILFILPACQGYILNLNYEYYVTVFYLGTLSIFVIHVMELYVCNLPVVHVLHHIFVFAAVVFGLEVTGYNNNMLLGRFVGISGFFFSLDVVKNIGLTSIRVFNDCKLQVRVFEICTGIDILFKVMNTAFDIWYISVNYQNFDAFLWFVAICCLTCVPGAQFYMSWILIKILEKRKKALQKRKVFGV